MPGNGKAFRLISRWLERGLVEGKFDFTKHLNAKLCLRSAVYRYAALSAVLVSTKVVDVLRHGSGAFNNGYTYQSNALACRAAIEVLKVIEADGL